MTDELRYPTGKFSPSDSKLSASDRTDLIDEIRDLPDRVREAVAGLDDSELDTPYRTDGWSPRQIVHHLVDSHLNAIVRMKKGLTEDNPTITGYEEARWAELADASLAVEPSLGILDGLHERWVHLLEHLDEGDWARTVVHPESGKVDLDWFLQLYAWHGAHHTSVIERLRKERGW